MAATRPQATPAPVIDVALPKQPGIARPVTLGVPFPQGQIHSLDRLAVRSPADALLPAAARPMFKWPDGSVRWALVAFMPTQGGPHALLCDADAPAIANPVTLTQQGDDITLANNLVSLTLSATGPGPVRQLIAQGHPWLDAPQAFKLRVDEYDTTHETSRTLTVLENSPLRARVRIEGAHLNAAGKRKLSYRLDVELWANQTAVRFDDHFFNLEPGSDELDVDHIAMQFDFNLGSRSSRRHFQQQTHGLYTIPRGVLNPDEVSLRVDEKHLRPLAEDPAMVMDDFDYPYYLRGPRVDCADWMGILADDGPCVYGMMHDFGPMRPKRIASQGRQLTLDIWPRCAGTLKLPQGRSRRQTFNLLFETQGPLKPGDITGRLEALVHEGRACVGRDWLVHCQVFDQHRLLAPGRNIRMEKYLNRLMKLRMPQSMFDLGDTAETGYQRTYIGVGYAQPLLENMPPRVYDTNTFIMPISNHLAYEPVWSNNEYDAIYAFTYELMRTGRSELWPVIKRLARHNIEVDFLHYSDHRWLHRATPAHSARHTSTGAYPSHFWTQGLLAYHCLSGDIDALEIATALGDKILENFHDPEMRSILWGFNRELGWPVLALSHLADLTGDARYKAMLEELVSFLVGFDREGFAGAVKLSSGNALHGLTRQMIDGFFGFVAMVEGVDHYLSHNDNPQAEAWFKNLLQDLTFHLDQAHQQGASLSISHMHSQGMAIAMDRVGDKQAVTLGMYSIQDLIDSSAWTQPLPEVKQVAMIYRGLARFLAHAQEIGWLAELDYKRFE